MQALPVATSVYRWLVDAEVSAIVGWLGTVTGVIGLGMTIAVFRSTNAIRREFLVSVRVPRQLQDLRTCSTALSGHLNGHDLDSPELLVQVARVSEIAASLRNKVLRERSGLPQKLARLSDLATSFGRRQTKERLTELWVHMQATEEAIVQWLQDRQWSHHGD